MKKNAECQLIIHSIREVTLPTKGLLLSFPWVQREKIGDSDYYAWKACIPQLQNELITRKVCEEWRQQALFEFSNGR